MDAEHVVSLMRLIAELYMQITNQAQTIRELQSRLAEQQASADT